MMRNPAKIAVLIQAQGKYIDSGEESTAKAVMARTHCRGAILVLIHILADLQLVKDKLLFQSQTESFIES
jgi:hypothetical protein